MQQVTPDIGDAFGPVETALWYALLLSLFQVVGEGNPWQGVPRLSFKQAGLALPDPTNTAPENWTASCVITRHLVAAFMDQEEFRTAYHSN